MTTAQVGIKLTLDGATQAEANLRRVEQGVKGIGSAAESVRGALGNLAGAFAGVVSVRAFVQAADAVTQLQNQLKLATGSIQSASVAYNQLFEIAQRSRVSFTELGGTFASIARASESLGLSQQQLLTLTETIGNAVTVSGASAQASQAALVQLSQGLASGVLRGEELNSILEQTPRLARALADGLGVPIGKLRELGQAGELTAEKVIGALQSQSKVLAAEVEQSVVTVGQAFTQVQNSATKLAGEIDRVTGSTGQLAVEAQAVSASLDNIARAFKDVDAAGRPVSLFGDAIAVVFETVAVLGANVAFVIKQIGTEIGGLAAQAAAVAQLDFSQAREIGRLMREDAAAARAEVDALSARILNARGQAEQVRKALQGVDTRAEDARLARSAGGIDAGTARASAQAAEAARRAAEAQKQALNDAKKAADEYAKSVERGAKLYADFTAQSGGLAANFAGQWQDLSNAFKAGSLNLEQLTAAQAALLAQQPFAKDLAKEQADALEAQAKAAETLARAEFERVEAAERNAASAQEQLQRLLDEERATALAAEKNITLAQAIEEVAIARLREQQAALLREGDRDAEVLAIQQEIDARKRLAEAIGRKENREVAERSAKDAAREWERTAENIERTLTDALMRGFESGKDFARVLRDTVVNMFKTMVLRPIIQAVVQPVAGALTGALGYAGAANASGSGAGMLSNGLSLASAYNSFGTVGGTLGAASGATYGTNAFSSQSMMLAAQDAGLSTSAMGTAGSLGTAATALGGALVGFMAGKVISGGYSAIGKSGNAAVGIGTAIGSFFGPIGAVIGGAIGGVVNVAFGRKLKEAGIEGTFSESGFDGNAYQFSKGGWFRSDKTTRSAIDPALDNLLDQQFMAIKASALGMAEVLGGAADALTGFNSNIKLNFKGLNEQQIGEKLSEAFGQVTEEAARQVLRRTAAGEVGSDYVQPFVEAFEADLAARQAVVAQLDEALQAALEDGLDGERGSFARYSSALRELNNLPPQDTRDGGVRAADAYLAQFTREGETAVQTLQRLSSSLALVNQVFDTLGTAAFDASIKAGDAASQLVDLFGGVQAFVQSTTAFYEQFYTETERIETSTRQLTEALGALGFNLPTTREAYRALVEAQDLTTESGRATYTALIQLSGAFDQVADSAEAAAKAARETATQEANAALRSLEVAVRAEQDRLREQFERESDVLRDRIGAIADVVGVLDSALQSVRATITSNSIASQTAARLTLQSVLTAVQGGADITGFAPVIEQASETLTQNDPNLYATREQFVRAQAQAAGLLDELKEVGGDQLTVAELQLQALEDGFDAQIRALDDLIANAKRQIDTLLGIDSSVLSVASATLKVEQAIKALEGALLSAVAARQTQIAPLVAAQATAAQQALATGAAGVGGVYDASAATPTTAREAEIAALYAATLGRAADVSGLQYWSSSSLSIDQIAANIAQSTEAAARAISVEAQNVFNQMVNEAIGSIGFNITARAQGGYTPSGLTLVGEQGPELVNFRNPAMVYNNGQTSDILGNREMVEELRALRNEVIELRVQARRTADATNGNPEQPMLVETVQ